MKNDKSMIARIILKKWVSALKDKDKSWASVAVNFEELFADWFTHGIDMQEAHELLEEAVRHHYPPAAVVRPVYQRAKSNGKMQLSEKEFIVQWQKNIHDVAIKTFFEWYQLEAPESERPYSPKEKHFGSVSGADYKEMRKFADSFPEIDVNNIEFNEIEEESLFEQDK